MKIHHRRLAVRTSGRISLENVTGQVMQEVTASGVDRGLAVVTVPHTTCGLVINEDELGLKRDMQRLAEKLLSPLEADGGFQHDRVDNNAQAHLTSILLGHSLTIPVVDARLELGTWQSVFLIEMDGPRSRELGVQVLGE